MTFSACDRRYQRVRPTYPPANSPAPTPKYPPTQPTYPHQATNTHPARSRLQPLSYPLTHLAFLLDYPRFVHGAYVGIVLLRDCSADGVPHHSGRLRREQCRGPRPHREADGAPGREKETRPRSSICHGSLELCVASMCVGGGIRYGMCVCINTCSSVWMKGVPSK